VLRKRRNDRGVREGRKREAYIKKNSARAGTSENQCKQKQHPLSQSAKRKSKTRYVTKFINLVEQQEEAIKPLKEPKNYRGVQNGLQDFLRKARSRRSRSCRKSELQTREHKNVCLRQRGTYSGKRALGVTRSREEPCQDLSLRG